MLPLTKSDKLNVLLSTGSTYPVPAVPAVSSSKLTMLLENAMSAATVRLFWFNTVSGSLVLCWVLEGHLHPFVLECCKSFQTYWSWKKLNRALG